MAEDGGRGLYDAAVIGAGPVGLSLALGLARRGRRVIVLEKEPSTAEHSRAPAIWPATQEILAELGVIETFFQEGITLSCPELLDVDSNAILFAIPLEELAGETLYPQLLIVPQSRTERLLFEALQREPSAEVQFSKVAVGLSQNEQQVAVQVRGRDGGIETISAKFAAGCDGARSTVREALDASFDGSTYRVRAALADVELADDEGLHFPRITTSPILAIGIKMKAHLWRMILPYPADDAMPLDRRISNAAAALFDREYREVWRSEFRLHRRVSSVFACGRVALAGDAAHLNSPVGGQGMNAGIRDAALLADALQRALESGSTAPVAEYAAKRRSGIQEGVNRFTDLLTRTLLFRQGRMVKPVFAVLQGAMRLPFFRRRFLRNLAMLDEGRPARRCSKPQ